MVKADGHTGEKRSADHRAVFRSTAGGPGIGVGFPDSARLGTDPAPREAALRDHPSPSARPFGCDNGDRSPIGRDLLLVDGSTSGQEGLLAAITVGTASHA